MKLLLAIVCLSVSLPGMKADSVSDILARMDKAAPLFHALSADLEMNTYQQIIDSHTDEKGTLQMQRTKKGDVRAIISFIGNSPRTFGFLGKIVRVYYPAIKQYQDVSLGNKADVVNQLLLLGFGSSGQDLSQGYAITDAGQEKISGQNSTKLLLTPKDSAVLERLTKVELWIPDRRTNPIQQKFYEQSGNYRQITYSNMQLNPSIPAKLELKVPKGASKKPQ